MDTQEPRERKTAVMMLRNYQKDEDTRLSKGSIVELSSKLANTLVKAGIASADAAIATE